MEEQGRGQLPGLEHPPDEGRGRRSGSADGDVSQVEHIIRKMDGTIGELMKAVSHAYARGRFQTYSG